MDYYIDEELSTEYIFQQLEKVEEMAKKKGYAIAVANPYPITARVLENWIRNLNTEIFQLVPLSTLKKSIERIE